MMSDKRLQIEGSSASKMVQLIRKHGYNGGWQAEVSQVTNLSPLTFRASDGIELNPDDYEINADIDGWQVGDSALALYNYDNPFQKCFVIMKIK